MTKWKLCDKGYNPKFSDCQTDNETSRSASGNKENDANNDDKHTGTKTDSQQINVDKIKEKIIRFRNMRKKVNHKNLTIVKRSRNVFQAVNLPKVLNLNPRSAMNKTEQISRFIEEENIDVAFISESHDREDKRLEDHIKLDKHTVISNRYQRPVKEKGGRPAIIANNEKYNIIHYKS